MSDHHHHHRDKEDKKKKQRDLNRKNWIIFQHAEMHRAKVDIGAPPNAVKAARAPEKDSKGEVVWSAKMDTIRNRLTNGRRMADDRWNRFAGTSGGGGRGR